MCGIVYDIVCDLWIMFFYQAVKEAKKIYKEAYDNFPNNNKDNTTLIDFHTIVSIDSVLFVWEMNINVQTWFNKHVIGRKATKSSSTTKSV